MIPYQPPDEPRPDQMESLEYKASQMQKVGLIEFLVVLAFLSGCVGGALEIIEFFVARVGR
jgi:hypothetical protein